MVILSTIGCFSLRLWLIEYLTHLHIAGAHAKGAAVGGVLTSIIIMAFKSIYSTMALYLNDWENYRTRTEWEDNLITKMFLFMGFNSYFSLLYIAFIKNNVCPFGQCDPCPDSNCMKPLAIQLMTVFATQLVVGQITEVVFPKIKKDMQEYMEKSKLQKEGKSINLPQEEKQNNLSSYEGVLDDYSAMVVQFGYVTLFASAFPAGAMLALINNLVSIRTDGIKLLELTRRPDRQQAEDIGRWADMLEVLSYISVFTNVLLIGFTSDGVAYYIQSDSLYSRLWVVIILEHGLVAIKLFLGFVIEDTPEGVLIESRKAERFKDAAIEKILDRKEGIPEFYLSPDELPDPIGKVEYNYGDGDGDIDGDGY